MIKKTVTSLAALCLAVACAVPAIAEVPTGTVIQNLNGVQQYIKTYTVPADVDPDSLVEESFDYDGYTYSFSSITKSEHLYEDSQFHTEVVTVETEKKDLSAVLAELPNAVEYDDGRYKGILTLDHSTIKTEAAGYKSGSYKLTATREIGDLPDNDLSRIPATTVKDGVTISLANVEWAVQANTLVGDMLVPSLYKAVATYSGTSYYKSATGYVSTAEYNGTITCSEIDSITYTVTYVGEKTAVPVEPEAAEDQSVVGENAVKESERAPDWLLLTGTLLIIIMTAMLSTFAGKYWATKDMKNKEGEDYDEYE